MIRFVRKNNKSTIQYKNSSMSEFKYDYNYNIDAKKNMTYDAIVIGSGMSGGWAAKELCEAGMKVLVLERGRIIQHIKFLLNVYIFYPINICTFIGIHINLFNSKC